MPPKKKNKKVKKTGPPKEELLRHQAVKELLRSAKVAKTLLIRKGIRKCKQLKDDESQEKKYILQQEQLQHLKDLSMDILQPILNDFIYGQVLDPLDNLSSFSTWSDLSDSNRAVIKEIVSQRNFRDMLSEQNEKIEKAKIPYKSKRMRQVEESAARKEAEGSTVRQKHKQNVGVFIESLEDATVTDVIPVVRPAVIKNKGTNGVPRHLRESHIEERKRQRQPDLTAYGPASASLNNNVAKVSHGNRASYGGDHVNKKVKLDNEKKAVSNDEWKKAGMHPSWLAKQKQKSQSATIGAISLSTNSGNKIKFSEDD